MGIEPMHEGRDVRDDAAVADRAMRREELRRRARIAVQREATGAALEAVADAAAPPASPPPTGAPAASGDATETVVGWYRGAPVYASAADDPPAGDASADGATGGHVVGWYRGAPIHAPTHDASMTSPAPAAESGAEPGVGERIRAWSRRRTRGAVRPEGAFAGALVAPTAEAAEELRVLSERYAHGEIDVSTYAHATAAVLGLA
ncbi:MAG: hypothetical protein S0880_35995 [Actinomycetota bacterium]|nr:hypothetical protein [Actinomycetota bacterium]